MNRRMGDILISMADEMSTSWDTDRAEAWINETVSIDNELDGAWQTVRFARESRQANPRYHLPTPSRSRNRRSGQAHESQTVGYEDILQRLSEGVSHLRHLARTLHEITHGDAPNDSDFRHRSIAIVRDTGHSIKDPYAEVDPIYDRLQDLAHRYAQNDADGLNAELWPIHGSLLTSMRHIATIIDDVASTRAARET